MRVLRRLLMMAASLLVLASLPGRVMGQDESVRTLESDYLAKEEAFVTNALFLAELHQGNGDFAAAGEICRRLMALRPGDRQLARRVGELYRRVGAHEDLVRLYESVLARTGDDVSLLTDLARARFDAGLAEEGLDACDRIIDLRGKSPGAFMGVSRDLAAGGSIKGAVIVLDQGIERYPEDSALRLARTSLLYRMGEYQRAAADARLLARQVSHDTPKVHLASFLLVRSLQGQGNLEDYFEETEEAMTSLEEKHAIALLTLANRLREEGEAGRALDRYGQITKLYPQSPQTQEAWEGARALDLDEKR